MKKIATITFHHAHNFGSALQAYALQQFVLSLYKENDVEYKIIDYYTELQEELYRGSMWHLLIVMIRLKMVRT